MSDQSQGPGWWMASDGKWYPPETHPSRGPEPLADLPSTELVTSGASLPAKTWRRFRGFPLWAQIVSAFVLLAVVTAPFAGSDEPEQVSASEELTDDEAATPTTEADAPTTTDKPTTTTEAPTTTTTAPPPPTTEDPFAGETLSQSNARDSATSYLDMSGFSRTGLIEQLEYEGFSREDASYAADVLHVDWSSEALESAESYLDMSGFSRTGLIAQLEYEGFTPAEAAHGADASNTDWNAEAAESAASYLDMTSFSRSGLIDQLVYEGFTQAQAEFGVSSTGL